MDNIEYGIVEPPEPYDDPEVPTMGGEFPSDNIRDGPVKPNFSRGKNYENVQKYKEGTIRKRVQLLRRNSQQVHHRNHRDQRSYSGAPGCDFLNSVGLTTDAVIWDYMCKVGKSLADTALLNIFSDFDGRVRTEELRRKMNNLEKLISEGSTDPMILKLWKIQLEAKKKESVEHQGIVPGTPESSDDEDAEGNDHESTFCALEPQKIIAWYHQMSEPAKFSTIRRHSRWYHKSLSLTLGHMKSPGARKDGVSAPNKSRSTIRYYGKKISR